MKTGQYGSFRWVIMFSLNWIIFSFLHFTEHILWFVPLYSLVKAGFLAWCLALAQPLS